MSAESMFAVTALHAAAGLRRYAVSPHEIRCTSVAAAIPGPVTTATEFVVTVPPRAGDVSFPRLLTVEWLLAGPA